MKKQLLCVLLVACSLITFSQVKHIFIRIYDLKGDRISRGKLFNVTDSSVILTSDNVQRELLVKEIGYIKTRRAIGHSVLIGAITGGVLVGAIAAASSHEDSSGFNFFDYSPGEGFAVGLISGGGFGAAIGALIGVAGKRKTITVNGNIAEWSKVKQVFSE